MRCSESTRRRRSGAGARCQRGFWGWWLFVRCFFCCLVGWLVSYGWLMLVGFFGCSNDFEAQARELPNTGARLRVAPKKKSSLDARPI